MVFTLASFLNQIHTVLFQVIPLVRVQGRLSRDASEKKISLTCLLDKPKARKAPKLSPARVEFAA